MRIGFAEEQEQATSEGSSAAAMNGTTIASDCDRVVSALSQTKKGQLKYDTKWKEEGRTEEIVNNVEEGLFSINFRPIKNGFNGGNVVGQQSMSSEYKTNKNNLYNYQPLNSTVKSEPQKNIDDVGQSNEVVINGRSVHQHTPPPSSVEKDENEELIKQYEQERSEKVQERVEQTTALLRANYDSLLETMDSEMRLIQNNFILMKLQTQKAYEEEYANLVRAMMIQEQNAMGNDGDRTIGEQPPTAVAASSKLKELQERQKLLERQKELRLQQQTEYRQRVTNAKEAISRILADCEARLQAEQKAHQELLRMDAFVTEQLEHCRILLLGAISDLEVMLATTNSSSQLGQEELTSEHLKLAAKKHQQATVVGQRYNDILTLQVDKLQGHQRTSSPPQQPQSLSSTVIQSAPEAARKAQPISSSTASSSTSQTSKSSTPSSSQQPSSSTSTSTSTSISTEKEFHMSVKLIYQRSQLELVRFETIVERFINAEENKKRRTSLQISIRTRINTMCNEAVSKLADKTRKLLDLLSGKRVEMTASKGDMVQCTPADGSLHFAINTAVMAFLNVAIKQKHMALRLAPVISLLWSRVDPLFGQIFLAHLYRICPYSLPYYPVQEEGQSAEEFMVMCGYQLNSQNGAISETDEAFQERVYSLIQLYAAVLQCNVTEANASVNGSNRIAHPRDLQYAWHWLARILNDLPQAVMTALMLDAFLAVTAHKLLAVYGRQFEKLLRHIRSSYLPQLEAVTPKGEQQTLMKFKSLLETLERKMAKRGGSQQMIARSLLPEDMELVPDAFFRI